MNCSNFHLVSKITTNSSFVILEFNETVTLENKNRICFKYKADIPESGDNLPVYIVANGTNVPLWDKYGNPLTGKELCKNRIYTGWYGSTTPHVIIPKVPVTINNSCGNIIG